MFIWLAIVVYFVLTEIICIVLLSKSSFSISQIRNSRFIYAAIFIVLYVLSRFLNERYLQFFNFLLVYAALGFLYLDSYYINKDLPKIDYWLVEVEQNIFGKQPAIDFSKRFSGKVFSELMFLAYFSYYLMPVAVAVSLFKKKYGNLFNFSFVLFASFFIYYLIFMLLPAVGPQYYFSPPDNEIVPKGLFGRIIKIIQYNSERPTAAFPSSHVGISIIMWMWVWRNEKKLVWYLTPFVLLLMAATVYIKAHYLVDVIAGLLSAPAIYFVVQFLFFKYSEYFIDADDHKRS